MTLTTTRSTCSTTMKEQEKDNKAMNKNLQYENRTGPILFILHFYATLVKRFYMALNSRLGLVFQVLMPLVFTGMRFLFIFEFL